jgi:phage N-6-adenine-methyltransferase
MKDQLRLFDLPQEGFTTDDYYTPKWLFDALKIEFDIDVACPPSGPPHTPCKHFYTQETDGLTSPWYGTVWMNPPYSKPAPWVDKWLEHADGIALLPYAKSKWLQKLWDHQETALMYVYSIKFERADSKLNGSTPFPLGIWGIGKKATNAMLNSGLGKIR